jgi:hypothetical protein
MFNVIVIIPRDQHSVCLTYLLTLFLESLKWKVSTEYRRCHFSSSSSSDPPLEIMIFILTKHEYSRVYLQVLNEPWKSFSCHLVSSAHRLLLYRYHVVRVARWCGQHSRQHLATPGNPACSWSRDTVFYTSGIANEMVEINYLVQG